MSFLPYAKVLMQDCEHGVIAINKTNYIRLCMCETSESSHTERCTNISQWGVIGG